MKTTKTFTQWLISALFLTHSVAFADLKSNKQHGNEHGNGGWIYQCANTNHLVDLKEVELRPALSNRVQIAYSNDEVETQVMRALKKVESINSQTFATLIKYYQNLVQKIQWLPEIEVFAVQKDLGLVTEMPNCPLKNIINYIDDFTIQGNAALFESLSKTEKAALYVHEVLYKLSRKNGKQVTSLAARRMTALLFSKNTDERLLKSMMSAFLEPESVTGKKVFVPASTVASLQLNIELTASLSTTHWLKIYRNQSLAGAYGVSRDLNRSLTVKLSSNQQIPETFVIQNVFMNMNGTSIRSLIRAEFEYDDETLAATYEDIDTMIESNNHLQRDYRFLIIPGTVADYMLARP